MQRVPTSVGPNIRRQGECPPPLHFTMQVSHVQKNRVKLAEAPKKGQEVTGEFDDA